MDLYREGFLNKAGKGLIQTHLHSWRPRYFVFDGKMLKYYKCKETLEENLLGTIDLAEVESVGLMKGEKKCFQITTKPPKPRTYYMSGQSEDEVIGWVRVFEMGKAKFDQTLDTQNPSNDISEPVPLSTPFNGPTKPARQNTIPSAYAVVSNQKCTTSETKPAVRSEYNCISDLAFKDDSCTYEVVNSEIRAQTLPPRPKPALPDRFHSKTNPPDDASQGSGESDSAEDLFCEDARLYDEIDNEQTKGIMSSRERGHPPDKSDLPPGQPDLPPRKPDFPVGGENPGKAIYAKVGKGKSLKKSGSKTNRPGMFDIGEVSQEVEEETAAGVEALKKGMTSPIGERFAIEELRDLLQQFDDENVENNNINIDEKFVDFKIDDDESAFSALKRFLDTY